jgi:predicted CXXCH cytochrome family protein
MCRVWAMLVIAIALFTVGCHREKDDAGSGTASSQPAGASPEHYENGVEQVKPVKFVRSTPATRPTAPLPAGRSCVTSACHANLADAPQVHAPVSLQSCNSCHDADAGGHRYPLKRPGNATCTFCHAVAGTMTHQHKALEQGCITCHSPHVSKTKFLLKTDTVEQLCATCHNVPLKKFAHEPFAKGQCTLCHQPHQAENAMLLRNGDGSKHCFTCHGELEKRMTLASATASSSVHKPAQQNCTNCHSPHATDFPHQLKTTIQQDCYTCHVSTEQKIKKASVSHGALTEASACANCHDPHAAQQPQLLKQRTDQLCMSCHDKEMKATDGHMIGNVKVVLTTSKFLHGPNKVGNCSACHDPHGADHTDLLKKEFPRSFYTRFDLKKYELCFGCHEPQMVLEPKTTTLTNFRNGETNLHFVHVNREDKGRSCKTCHAVHGSDLPNHMASEVPFEGSRWAMPIDYQQTPTGGSCAPGCHTPREYKRGATTQPTLKMPTTIRGVP